MTVESIIDLFKKLLDILLVWGMLYYILKTIRKNVKMVLLFKGLLIIVVVKLLSDFLDLVTIGYIIDYVIEWAPLAIVIIFQPEIRDALEQLGRANLLGKHKTLSMSEKEKTINEIAKALESLKKQRMGALIVLERDTSLVNNPLHDGGVIIQGNEIACANAVFPTSDNLTISKRLGTRHRAALGISEQSDCIAIVLSEETGRISLAVNGSLMYNLTLAELKVRLLEGLTPSKKLLMKEMEATSDEN